MSYPQLKKVFWQMVLEVADSIDIFYIHREAIHGHMYLPKLGIRMLITINMFFIYAIIRCYRLISVGAHAQPASHTSVNSIFLARGRTSPLWA